MNFSKITNYFVQSYEELKRVSWPSKKEIIRLTIIVIISTIIAMLLISGLDWVLTKLVNYFIIKNSP